MSTTIESRLRDVFANVLGVQGDSLSDDSSPESIAAWDSLNHVSLMMAIEVELGVQFDPSEMMSLQTYGAILERIHRSEAA